jgi:hypothetical protein
VEKVLEALNAFIKAELGAGRSATAALEGLRTDLGDRIKLSRAFDDQILGLVKPPPASDVVAGRAVVPCPPADPA